MKIKKVKYLLNEETLNEDKTVKFNGESYPNYGWCVILCGGPGSGKSTAYNTLVSINARKFDVDALKTFKLRGSEIDGKKMVMKNGEVWDLSNISEPYDLTNPEFTRLVHEKTRPLARRVKSQIFSSGELTDKSRLPNVVFDITGSDIEDFMTIISNMKPIGYNISVVWVLNDIYSAIQNNKKRERQVPQDILVSNNRSVFQTVEKIFGDREMLRNISEFWIVLSSPFDPNDESDTLRYKNLPNVYQIKTKEDVVDLPNRLQLMINRQNKAMRDISLEGK